jgi:hypothetical protein
MPVLLDGFPFLVSERTGCLASAVKNKLMCRYRRAGCGVRTVK